MSVSTVKRWVDEGVLPAHVTPGGHRKLMRAEVLALARQGAVPHGNLTTLGTDTDAAAFSQTLLDAVVAGRGAEARTTVRRAYEAGLPIEDLADRVVAPVMAAVGHGWETARLDLWQEHRGIEICAAALYDLRDELEARAESGRPVAVGAAPEGDYYTLPSLLAQMVLLDAGWDAVNIGPNTPLSSLSRAVRELRPRLVWLSVSHLQDELGFRHAYDQFSRVAEREGAAIVVGGRALGEALRSSMRYTAHGDGLSHLAALARTLHPRPPRPRRGRPKG